MGLVLQLIATSVGMPAPLGSWQGEEVESGIRKTPLSAPMVTVATLNLAGDGQADLTVHGGPDKAIYAYPADNWPWWKDQARFDAVPASFGENLTVKGADEHAVRIGDRFSWGTTELEVSQPRGPCFKFTMLTGRDDMAARMTISGRPGWYYRVLKEGSAPTQGELVRTHTNEEMPTVYEAFIAVYHPRVAVDVLEKVANAKPLAHQWRDALVRRFRAAGLI